MSLPAEQAEELRRVRRVSDMLCTGHAVLRDRFSRKALALDILTLAFSTWMVTALRGISCRLSKKTLPPPRRWLSR